MAELNIEKMAQNVVERALQELRDNGVFVSRWIPVSSGRLPEDNTIVLVTFACETVGTSSWHSSTNYNNGFDGIMHGITEDGKVINYGVVAWMPLPEPYKAESEKSSQD